MYDVIIIGGGITGTAIARNLSRYRLRVLLLEKQPDIAMGATKANSAIVHGGYAEAHSKLKGKLCYQGRKQFAQLEQELHFGFKPIGSMVLAFEEGQREPLQALLQNGQKNGLEDIEILNREEILQREPHVNPQVKYALYCKGAGVCSPFGMAVALAENAVKNGVQLKVNCEVQRIEKQNGSFQVTAGEGETFQARYIINAAGLAAEKVARLAGAASFSIHPRSGEYILLNRGSGSLVNHVLFQMPTPMGKGILVAPTVWGNLLIGPDAIDEERDDRNTHLNRLYSIYQQALFTTQGINLQRFLRSFAGVRPVSNTDDFVIEQAIPGFINVAGIQSPGLTAAPAVADRVASILEQAGLPLQPDPAFSPTRTAEEVPYPALPADEMQRRLALPEGESGRMVCRCEQVAEKTIQSALSNGIPVTTVDAVKRRTRAGMGFCQGAFCRPRVTALLRNRYGDTVMPETDVERDGLARVTRDEMLAYAKQQDAQATEA